MIIVLTLEASFQCLNTQLLRLFVLQNKKNDAKSVIQNRLSNLLADSFVKIPSLKLKIITSLLQTNIYNLFNNVSTLTSQYEFRFSSCDVRVYGMFFACVF